MYSLKEKNSMIISVQCSDPVTDMLSQFTKDDDWSLMDQLELIQRDLESKDKKFLEDDLRELFSKLGMEAEY